LDADTCGTLREPLQLVQTQLPHRTDDIGPCEPELRAFLDAVAALDSAGRDQFRRTADGLRAVGQEWAAAVHEASWAALTTGRIRAAATAQLLGVQAFRTAGFTAADGAEGLWNTVSGHIQAEAMGDVLSAETYSYLTRTWRAALTAA
jgi:hypothetical protein